MKYLPQILRNFKTSSVINLIGLTVGFSVLILISFFIKDELSYNKFHENIDNLYSIYTHNHLNSFGWNESVPALPEAMRKEYPGVKDAALLKNSKEKWLLTIGDKKSYEHVQLGEPNLFNIFSFPILQGQIPKNTSQTKILAISKKMALKYFGKANPVGESIEINNKDKFTVVAVFDDIPSNSSIRFNFWAPVQLLEEQVSEGYLDTWYNLSFHAYVLLHDNVSYKEINKKLYNRIQQSNPESKERARLYPFEDLYLKAWGHQKSIHMMMLIGFIILILVSINFINLRIAETFEKIKDFGVKKIHGAKNASIYKELIYEALFFVAIGGIFAILITYLITPNLLNFIGKSGAQHSIISFYSIFTLGAAALIIALLSGIIPGLTIKSISPTNALKGKFSEKLGIKKLRYILISLQFSLAIGLIICLFISNKQLSFLRNKDLGFDKEQIMYINLEGKLIKKKKKQPCACLIIKFAKIVNRWPAGCRVETR